MLLQKQSSLAAGGILYQIQTGYTDAPHPLAAVSSLPQRQCQQVAIPGPRAGSSEVYRMPRLKTVFGE